MSRKNSNEDKENAVSSAAAAAASAAAPTLIQQVDADLGLSVSSGGGVDAPSKLTKQHSGFSSRASVRSRDEKISVKERTKTFNRLASEVSKVG